MTVARKSEWQVMCRQENVKAKNEGGGVKRRRGVKMRMLDDETE
jgi:hypothetical protein